MMMQSNDTIDPNQLPKCRICWQESGHKISPCSCTGSMAYIHQQCLKLWIQKSVERGNRNTTVKEDGYTSINCQLCMGDILFKMNREAACLKSHQIREKIRENVGGFFVMLFVIVGMAVIACVLIAEGISDLVSGQYTIWGTIFLFCFVGLIFALQIRFLYSFIKTFFRGNNYDIYSFKQRGR